VKSPFVAQIFIYGSSLKASLVAVVVPDPEILLPWAKEKAIDVRPHQHTRHTRHTRSFSVRCVR
jgi:long-subunit acyl-CoA synthetase (AMP-forming)